MHTQTSELVLMDKIMKTFLAILCASLLLSGCSSKWAYNNVDWLLYWYVDDYIDLGKDQKSLLDGKVEQWHKWHRQEELAQYKQQLIDLRARVNQANLSAEQWQLEFAKGSDHWKRFRAEIVPELSVLAVDLSDQQIEQLFDALEKENIEEQEDRDEDSLEERQEDAKERLHKQVKKQIGRLSSEQKIILDGYFGRFESTFDLWLSYRRLVQSKTKELMLNRNNLTDFSNQLSNLLMEPEQLRTQEHEAAIERNSVLFGEMLSEIQTSLSEKQYKHLNGEIDDLIDDINDLIEG